MAGAAPRLDGEGASGDGGARLRLLGGFSLTIGGEERGADVPLRARALLAYLAVHAGVSVERQRLAFLMWPDSTEGQARTNLRNLVHHLRRSWPNLESVVDVTSTSLRWVAGGRCQVDVAELLDALGSLAGAPGRSPARLSALRRVVDRYAGDLLEGSAEEWLDDERSRLRDRYLEALRELTEWLIEDAAGDAVARARELVRREPLAEDHHRLLIRAHAASGDRAGAMRAYHECDTVLRQELGVEPAAATVALYHRLIADAPAEVSTASRGPAPTSATLLVGRRDEHRALMTAWRAATDGRAQLVLLTGEAGIGKTRLVEELAADCARAGAVVASARAYAAEGDLGYGVVREWLRTPEITAALAGVTGADLTDLSHLLPELGDARNAPAAPTLELDRGRLFAAATRALSTLNRPVLLVADDVHWADEASVQMLHYLVRSVTAPVLVAATARREALDDAHPVTGLVHALQVIDRATVVALGRLTPAETGQLAAALGAAPLERSCVADLHRETEGNPLFVVEAVRAGWSAGTARIDLSPKLQAVIAGRLAQLSEQARTVAGVAATIGRAFTVDLVRAATGIDELALVRSLDELWRRGVIEGREPDGYDFTHGKIRDAAYESLSPAVRALNHLRVAEALQVPVADHAAVSGLIATHLDRAGRVEPAVRWYREAAAQAIRLASHVEAVRLLDRARELVAAMPGDDGLRAELAILSLLPAALGGVDGFASDRLTSAQRRAQAVAAELRTDLDPAMLRSLVMSSLCRDEFDEARAAAERLHAAGAAHDEGLEIEAEYLLGITAFWSGRLDEAASRFEGVVDRFDVDRHPEHVVRFGHDPRAVCLSRLGNTLWLLGRGDEAVGARDRAVAMADDVGELLTVMTVRIFAALLSLDLDDVAGYRRAVLALDPRDRSGAHAVKTSALRGHLEVLDGRAASGISRIEASLAQCGGRNLAPGFVASLLRVLVAAHSLGSDPASGLAASDRALALGGTRLWLPEVHRLRATFLARLGGGPGEAVAELDRAAAVATELAAAGPNARIEATRRQLALAWEHETVGKRSGNG